MGGGGGGVSTIYFHNFAILFWDSHAQKSSTFLPLNDIILADFVCLLLRIGWNANLSWTGKKTRHFLLDRAAKLKSFCLEGRQGFAESAESPYPNALGGGGGGGGVLFSQTVTAKQRTRLMACALSKLAAETTNSVFPRILWSWKIKRILRPVLTLYCTPIQPERGRRRGWKRRRWRRGWKRRRWRRGWERRSWRRWRRLKATQRTATTKAESDAAHGDDGAWKRRRWRRWRRLKATKADINVDAVSPRLPPRLR